MKYTLILLVVAMVACAEKESKHTKTSLARISVIVEQDTSVLLPKEKIANRFDYPVGKPDAKGYYNAQKFGANDHLGDDWNAVTGGNSDLGDPIYSIANGQVDFAEDIGGGWGNVIRITHQLPSGQTVESLYAHCDTILVQTNHWVKRGEQIGTIGTANGVYIAHLHFEMRDSLMPIGGGYSADNQGFISPTEFIERHRYVK